MSAAAAPATGPSLVRVPPGASAALRGLSKGQGSLLLLSGGARSTRSAIVRALEQEVAGSEWECLSFRVHPLDQEVPFGALQPWLSRWHATHAEPSSGDRTRISASLSIALVGLLAPGPAPSGEARTASPSTAATPALSPVDVRMSLLELIEDQAVRRPSVVVLEDAEYLDLSSWAWLTFLQHRLKSLPLVVVLALDEGGRPEGSTSSASRTPGSEGLVICPVLEEPAASAGSDWTARLRTLPPRSLQALAAAVLAGPDADRKVLGETLGWSERDVDAALSTAVDAGLLAARDGSFETIEPRLFPDLAGLLGKSESTRLHRALALSLQQRDPHPRGARLFRLSGHWAEGGEVATGVKALLASAEEAERWGAPELAERALRRAIVLAQTDPTSRGREAEEQAYAALAESRARAGAATGAADAYRRAMRLAQDRGARVVHWARYAAGLADAEVRLGADPEPELKQLLAQVQGRSPELEAALLRSLSRYYMHRSRPEQAVQAAERACAISAKLKEPALRARARLAAANAYLFSAEDPERALAHLRAGLEERSSLEGGPSEDVVVNLTGAYAGIEASLGDLPEALHWAEEAVAAARRVGSRTSLLTALGNLAEYALQAGQLARVEELLQEVRWTCDRLGIAETDTPHLQLTLVEGLLAMAQHRPDEGRRRLEQLVSVSEKGGVRFFLGQALVHLAFFAAEEGDLSQARPYLKRVDKEGLRRSLMGDLRRRLDETEKKVDSASHKDARVR